MSDPKPNPWPEMRKKMIEQLAKAPKPKPKPDYRAIWKARQRREQENE